MNPDPLTPGPGVPVSTAAAAARDAYSRGQESGRVEARLRDHDQHYAQINMSLTEMTGALEAVTAEVRTTLAELRGDIETVRVEGVTRDETTVTVAADLAEATRTPGFPQWVLPLIGLVVALLLVTTSLLVILIYR